MSARKHVLNAIKDSAGGIVLKPVGDSLGSKPAYRVNVFLREGQNVAAPKKPLTKRIRSLKTKVDKSKPWKKRRDWKL